MKNKLLPFLIAAFINTAAYAQDIREIPANKIPAEMVLKIQQDFPSAKSETNWFFDSTAKVYLAKFAYKKRPTIVTFDENHTWVSTIISAPQYITKLPKIMDNSIIKYFNDRNNVMIRKVQTPAKTYYHVEADEAYATTNPTIYAIDFTMNGEVIEKYAAKEKMVD